MKQPRDRTVRRARKATKILSAQDRGRPVLKVVVRMPDGLDDAAARQVSKLIGEAVREEAPRGAQVEMTLRRHNDTTGNMLEGEAEKKRYSNASKAAVMTPERCVHARPENFCALKQETVSETCADSCFRYTKPEVRR